MSASDSDLPDAPATPRRRFGAVRMVVLGIAVLLAVVLIGVWSERKPIASSYIDRELAARGVPARYRIADLGFGRQRLTDVVIGDPAHPDLIADWIELHTAIGLSGAHVTGIRAGHVRMRGRLVDGTVSLGTIDQLLPAPSGAPFALPAIDADIADLRVRLETPQGLFGVKISGAGRLDGGFAGQVAAISDRVAARACTADRVEAVMAVRIAQARPSLRGPIRARDVTCGATKIARLAANLDLTLDQALKRVTGNARIAVAQVAHPQARVNGVAGTVSFDGPFAALRGNIDLHSGAFSTADAGGSALGISGTYASGTSGVLVGDADSPLRLTMRDVRVAPARLRAIAAIGSRAAGTPLGPVADHIARAVAAAGAGFDVDADVSGRVGGGATALTLGSMTLDARSGARIVLSKGAQIRYASSGPALIAGTVLVGGGGLPQGTIALRQAAPGAARYGTASFAPYAAGDARLMLAPIAIVQTPSGAMRWTTTIDLSGPLGDGRVDSLRLPIDARWDGGQRLVLNPGCAPLSFQRVAVSGLVLRPATLALCPNDAALFSLDRGTVRGGAQIASPRLSGAIGSSPLTLSTTRISARLDTPGFTATGLAARIGAPDRITRLDIARLDGRLSGGTIDGRFSDGAGQIGNVPLLLSRMAGDWSLRGGALAVNGTLAVDDAAPDKRFNTLDGRDVALTLAGGRIAATGTLVTPAKGIEVARVSIAHDLAQGTGHADLTVPGITFGNALQPEQLTRLTAGVIADVEGKVSGEGHIRWSPAGVASDGTFRTANTDLAAAIGPVTGIAGEIRFTDLLALQSAPGQVATIKSINPGVPVTGGTIRYQTLPDARIKVEEGRWPFAGGTLVLEPTLLDFGAAQERHMTFRMTGLDAAQFLQQFDFKNLNATGTFDGVLPMVFDASGGTLRDGRLKVREGGGTIAYVGEISQKDLGTWGNLAFQTLKSLKYRSLDIVMNGPLAGEIITEVRFAGIGQGEGAKRNFIVSRLAKLPIVFNVRIQAPFRSLIDSAASFYDPSRLIQRNLPTLLQEQGKQSPQPAPPANSIQLTESRNAP